MNSDDICRSRAAGSYDPYPRGLTRTPSGGAERAADALGSGGPSASVAYDTTVFLTAHCSRPATPAAEFGR